MLLQKLKCRFYLAKITEKLPLNSSSRISHFGLFYKGKFETKARILAIRQHLLAAGDLTIQGSFSVIFAYVIKFYDWNAIENSIIHTGKITI